MDELTVMQALNEICPGESTIIEYFRFLGLLVHSPHPSVKWSSGMIFRQLQQHYKRTLWSLHPDKSGSGDAGKLHLVRDAWAKLKELHTHPIDLTLDDDSDDNSSDKDDGSEGETTTGRQSSNAGALVLACNDPSPSLLSERAESDRADDANKEDANSVEDTNNPHYQCYMGKAVKKGFLFRGRVTSLDLGKTKNENEVVLVHVQFDDGDEEDYELSEWQSELDIDDASTPICEQYHPLGAIVWKKFYLDGEVTGYRIGEPVVIFVMRCDEE